MSARRVCQSCAGPRPSAAVRCPWCLMSYTVSAQVPEHIFATYEGEQGRPAPAQSYTTERPPRSQN